MRIQGSRDNHIHRHCGHVHVCVRPPELILFLLLREDNVFKDVCHSVRGGGGVESHVIINHDALIGPHHTQDPSAPWTWGSLYRPPSN